MKDFYTEKDAKDILRSSTDPQVRSMGDRASTVKAFTKVINTAIKETVKPGGLSRYVVDQASNISSAAVLFSTENKDSLKAFNLLKDIGRATYSLKDVASLSPSKAVLTITLVSAKKIAMAAGYAEMDRCSVAVASFTANTGLTILGVAGSGGLFVALGAISIAADAFDVYAKCTDSPSRKTKNGGQARATMHHN